MADIEKIELLAKKRIAESKSDYDIRLKFPNEYALNLADGRRTKGSESASWRCNYFYPTIPSAIMTAHPRLLDGLIGPDGTEFFDLTADANMDAVNKDPKGPQMGTSLKQHAEIIKALQNKHFADRGMFYNVQGQIEHNSEVLGAGYSITGWEDYIEEYTYYVPRRNKLFKETVKKRICRPTRYCPSSTDIFVDPNAKTWEDKTYVTERQQLRLSQLKSMVNRWNQAERFNDVLNDIEKEIENSQSSQTAENSKDLASPTNIDPVQNIFNVYEKGAITTMWRNKCIRFCDHPFAHNNIPVYAYQFRPNVYRYAPKGLPLILCDINEAQNTALNIMLDSWIIQVNPVFKERRNAFVDTGSMTWEPGKRVLLDDMNDFEELIKSNTNVESAMIIEKLAGIANQASASQDLMNAPTGVADVNKTFGGIRTIQKEGNQSWLAIINHQKRTALLPELQDTLSNYYQFMDESLVADVLGPELATKLNYTKDFKIAWDANWKYTITGNISIVDKQTKLESIGQALDAFMKVAQVKQLGIPIKTEQITDQICDGLDVSKDIIGDWPTTTVAPGNTPPPPNGPPPAETPAPVPPAPAGTVNTQSQAQPLNTDQLAQIPQIAKTLDTSPEQLLQDLQKGIIPSFEALEFIVSTPENIAKFKSQIK